MLPQLCAHMVTNKGTLLNQIYGAHGVRLHEREVRGAHGVRLHEREEPARPNPFPNLDPKPGP